ncbi:hypothetical protein HOY34_20520 [Xinfangfangia sp. D13-10-4-6]|uniref:DUF1376 domain-containing protein n=1 Tax=Pseudogemmobacter hezensis TaxID=2737662 RepID=UPI001553EE40|nr:hypothetical protein [Pseudogemmobacter hezensis]NPD17573.1 hypothetical protein [Pseudogemmobacter hezensis]
MAEYYKFEIANWNEGTANLSLEQEAAYLRVVNAIRLADQPITFNMFVLGGLWRCNERKAKRLLEELIGLGKLRVEGGRIINDKAVEAASNLRRLRTDRASAGRAGGIESGNSRRKSLESQETGEAIASTREEKNREEKSINGGDGSACVREADPDLPQQDLTEREQILDAMGVSPSGFTGPSSHIGGQGDMAEAQRWLALPGMSLPVVLTEIRRIVASKQDGPPKSFRYFTDAMQRLSGQLSAPPLQPTAGQGPRTASASGCQPDLSASIARLEAQGRI